MHLLVAHPQIVFHYLVAFADQLYVAIFNAIVHHFHEVTSPSFANPVAARSAVFDMGADCLEYRFHVRPCCRRAAWHHGRSFQGAFLASGNPSADVQESFTLDVFSTTGSVRKMSVATINDYVSLVQKRDKTLDKIVHGLAGLDHEEYLTRSFQRSYEIFQRMSPVEILVLSSVFHEMVDFLDRTIVHAHMEPLAFHVQRQVLAHDSETYQSDV